MKKSTIDKINNDTFFKKCIHNNNECSGRITMEHAFARGKRGIFEDIVVPCCWKHNVGVSGDDKRYNEYIAMKYYGVEYLEKICPKRNWKQEFTYLDGKFNKNDKITKQNILI